MEVVTAYLGLGSNIGERENHLTRAAFLLAEDPKVEITRSSSLYQTAPWGYLEQPVFLNCVLEIRTTLDPSPLLELTQRIEQVIGRQPGIRFGPRIVDIDILLYGEHQVHLEQPDLQIPHPRMHLRAFVLVPLAELVPNQVLPAWYATAEALKSGVEGKEGVQLWGPPLSLNP